MLLAGSLFLGAACSPEEEAPTGPATPTITPGPVTLRPERRSENKKKDAATAIVPAPGLDNQASDAIPSPTPTP